MDKIYYISQGKTIKNHLINIENACIAGCRLIQLRLKDVASKEFEEAAVQAKGICVQFGAKLIINDNVQVALAVKADGIHVGKTDMAADEVRMLAPDLIIGGTANNLEDCLALIDKKVDYIGLGPFRHTNTKQNLSPILGTAGYTEILSKLQELGPKTPIYAIGGILPKDVTEIYKTGVFGLAVSGVMTNKEPEELVRIYKNLQPQLENA